MYRDAFHSAAAIRAMGNVLSAVVSNKSAMVLMALNFRTFVLDYGRDAFMTAIVAAIKTTSVHARTAVNDDCGKQQGYECEQLFLHNRAKIKPKGKNWPATIVK